MHPIIEKIDQIALSLNLDVQNKATNSISIWTSPFLGIQLKIEVYENNLFNFYFTQRTTSWVYNGERTDLHDSISTIFAAYLKTLKFCSSKLIDVRNPVTRSNVEIYSRFIIPFQKDENLLNPKDFSRFEQLITSISFFEHRLWNCFGGCPCDDCRKKLGFTYDFRWEEITADKMDNIFNIFGNSESISYCERNLPTWFYYRNFSRKITLIESLELIHFMDPLLKKDTNTLKGINGELYLESYSKHFLSYNIKKTIHSYFKKLKDTTPRFVLLETKIIAIGSRFILTFDKSCGLDSFKLEKEKIKVRHKNEFDQLFSPSQLIWKEKLVDSLFEELIKELLEREPMVSRVRKVAHTRERDGDVDLVADWLIPKEDIEIINEESKPFKKINVIVQCKAYKNGVGKQDVTDIRDTVDYRNYDGYFLVVSSYTKKSLSDYLDKLRVDGKIWIDWWTKAEIEERLKKHEDLILKYNSIVSFKNQ